jgi:hypothetical protein
MSLSWYETHPPVPQCLGCGCRPRIGEWCQQCEAERTCSWCGAFFAEPLILVDGLAWCAACYYADDSGAGDVPMVADLSSSSEAPLGQSTGWPAFSRWWVDLSDVCEDVYRAVGPWAYAMLAVWFGLFLLWAVQS